MEYGIFSNGQSLSDLLEEDDEAMDDEAVDDEAVDDELQLSMVQRMQAGCNSQSGIDSILMANAKNRKLAYLETAETQIKALGGTPLDNLVQGLMVSKASAR